jgi:hypothetical protein
MVWTAYFQSTVLPAQSSVWIVDIKGAPTGCVVAAWTAVSNNTAAVQVSPASGTGDQVELFMPPNTGDQRTTLVTIAGQTATVTQAGR